VSALPLASHDVDVEEVVDDKVDEHFAYSYRLIPRLIFIAWSDTTETSKVKKKPIAIQPRLQRLKKKR